MSGFLSVCVCVRMCYFQVFLYFSILEQVFGLRHRSQRTVDHAANSCVMRPPASLTGSPSLYISQSLSDFHAGFVLCHVCL